MLHFNIRIKIFFLIVANLTMIISYGQTNTITLLTDLGTRYDYAYTITIQEDEKVLVAGDSWGNPFMLRFDTNGLLDPTFGSYGKVFASWDGVGNPGDNDVKIQSDGKIILGTSYNNGSDSDFIVARYNADGTPDDSFGSNGQVITKIGISHDRCNSISIQSDGKIVAGGIMNNIPHSGENNKFALIRYNVDGTLDYSFGNEGKVTTQIGLFNSLAYSMVIQKDGKIILAGQATDSIYSAPSDITLVRYNPDGTLDDSFGDDGIVRTVLSPFVNSAKSVALQSDEKILIAGSSQRDLYNTDFALLRYNTDGSLDKTFGSDGITLTDFGSDQGSSMALQADQKIVIAGSTDSETWSNFAALRYNVNGSLDNSFGTNGLITTSFGNGNSGGLAVASRSNGEIVIAGYFNHRTPLFMDIALVRLFSDLSYIVASPNLLSPSSGVNGQPTNLTLTWSPVSEASSYHLQVSSTIGFDNPIINKPDLTANSYQTDSLKNNTTYFWRVSANYGDISSWSDTWHFATTSPITEISEDWAGILSVYLIPNSETLIIEGIENQRTAVSILSIEGKMIKQLAKIGIRQISVSGIPTGVYIFQISNSKMNVTKKIFIE